MTMNPHIVGPEELRRMSGKQTTAAVCRWASARGIRVIEGADGPWTTVEALNAAMGVNSAANDKAYAQDIL